MEARKQDGSFLCLQLPIGSFELLAPRVGEADPAVALTNKTVVNSLPTATCSFRWSSLKVIGRMRQEKRKRFLHLCEKSVGSQLLFVNVPFICFVCATHPPVSTPSPRRGAGLRAGSHVRHKSQRRTEMQMAKEFLSSTMPSMLETRLALDSLHLVVETNER